jgi:hypothetical protein
LVPRKQLFNTGTIDSVTERHLAFVAVIHFVSFVRP